MTEEKFTLVIRKAPLWSSFRYWAYLYLNNVEIADEPIDTKWGAKWWARRTKKEILARRGKSNVIEKVEI